jgi:hypothetical protein
VWNLTSGSFICSPFHPDPHSNQKIKSGWESCQCQLIQSVNHIQTILCIKEEQSIFVCIPIWICCNLELHIQQSVHLRGKVSLQVAQYVETKGTPHPIFSSSTTNCTKHMPAVQKHRNRFTNSVQAIYADAWSEFTAINPNIRCHIGLDCIPHVEKY